MINDAEDFIPLPKKDKTGWPEFSTFIKGEFDAIHLETKEVASVYNPVKGKHASHLGAMVGSLTASGDTEDNLRLKAGNAVYRVKNHGIFDLVWKLIIDEISSLSSSVHHGTVNYGSFEVGLSLVGSPSKIGFVAAADEVQSLPQAGEIYIDVGGSVSAAILTEINSQLTKYAPPYFIIYIGWLTTVDDTFFVVGTSDVGSGDLIGVDPDPIYTFNSKQRIG